MEESRYWGRGSLKECNNYLWINKGMLLMIEQLESPWVGLFTGNSNGMALTSITSKLIEDNIYSC